LASVAPQKLDELQKTLDGQQCAVIGVVVPEPRVTVDCRGKTILSLSLDQILKAWNNLEAVR
jgi:phosphoribosylformylglycinamidine (FGAM) synthase-like enzyme